jgi:hypothetical protein
MNYLEPDTLAFICERKSDFQVSNHLFKLVNYENL